MNHEFSFFTVEELQHLLAEADKRLCTALLNGAGWEEIRDERFYITSINREIHHRKFPIHQTPAETPFRTDY